MITRYFGMEKFDRDILTRAKTVAHLASLVGEPLPWDKTFEPGELAAGDHLVLVDAKDADEGRLSDRIQHAVVTDVRLQRMDEIDEKDLVQINTSMSKGGYAGWWIETHHTEMAWRVEWQYVESPK